MTESVTIKLAGVIKGKGRPRFARATGRAYTPEPTRNYEAALRIAAAAAMVGRQPMTGALAINVIANMPIPASWPAKKQAQAANNELHPEVKPDFDNIMKMLDAFNQIVWCDDKQVIQANMLKRYSMHPQLIVTVRPL